MSVCRLTDTFDKGWSDIIPDVCGNSGRPWRQGMPVAPKRIL